jgi:hypothetical protein
MTDHESHEILRGYIFSIFLLTPFPTVIEYVIEAISLPTRLFEIGIMFGFVKEPSILPLSVKFILLLFYNYTVYLSKRRSFAIPT